MLYNHAHAHGNLLNLVPSGIHGQYAIGCQTTANSRTDDTAWAHE
jgi:hypothetical protein